MQTWVVAVVAVVVVAVAVLVAALRVRALNRPQPRLPVAPGAVADMPEDGLAEVQALLRSGKKVMAIKRLRELTEMSLAEAKRTADAMEAGGMAREPGDPRPAPGPGAAARARALPPRVREQAGRLVAQRRLVHAIKVIREGTGMGLREAKETAEALAADPSGGAPPDPYAAGPSGTTAGRGDLATRVRALRADDRTGEAIELVAAETGMSLVDATRFVESVSA